MDVHEHARRLLSRLPMADAVESLVTTHGWDLTLVALARFESSEPDLTAAARRAFGYAWERVVFAPLGYAMRQHNIETALRDPSLWGDAEG